jgi:hypothetical protein
MEKTLKIQLKELREQVAEEILNSPIPENLDVNIRLGFNLAQIKFYKLVLGEPSNESD